MRAIGYDELTRMMDEGNSAMFDSCEILTYSSGSGADAYNTPNPTYTSGSEIPCAYDPRSSAERRTFELTQVVFDATARFDINTVLSELDNVRITKRFGVAIDPIEYGLNGAPHIRPTYKLALLKKVTK